MKVRILHEEVKHNGHILEQYEVYDLPDANAAQLIEVGVAEEAGEKKDARPEPDPVPRTDEPVDHYVAEAKIDENRLTPEQLEQKAKIDAEGKPVIPPTSEQDPTEEVVVSNPQDNTPGETTQPSTSETSPTSDSAGPGNPQE